MNADPELSTAIHNQTSNTQHFTAGVTFLPFLRYSLLGMEIACQKIHPQSMIKNYFLLLLSFSFGLLAFSQEEDASCADPGKKAQKYIDVANNAADAKTAVDNFMKAAAEEPENAGAYVEWGRFAYEAGVHAYENNPNQSVGDRHFASAEEKLLQAMELCPDYHSDIYYLLGVINYTQNDQASAVEYFKKFTAYKNTKNERYAADFSKQLADVKGFLKELESDAEFQSKTVPFNPVKVPNVSSANDEYFPMISPDNELMFYTRKVNKSNLGDEMYSGKMNVEEFTFSLRADESSPFDNGHPFKAPFNDGSFDSYGAATVSVDNKEMIICACKKTEVRSQPYLNCDLFSTTFERIGEDGNDYKWSELMNLGPKINTPDGWEGQPSLSADGNTLFYTTTRATTRDNDIYIAKRNPDGSWGTPRPFDEINTAGKDKSPFLHQDSETMYFVSSSSDDRKGAGGLDIFYMREENGKWTKPQNIGIPINTENDELGIFVSTDGKLAYYSAQVQGKWDIYGFELYEEARPKPVTILKGELRDPEGNPVSGATIEIAYAQTEKVESVKVNGNDGKYAVVVKQDIPQDVMVSVKKEGSAFESKLVTKEEIAEPDKRKNNDLAVKELKVGEAYTINDILYGYNSAELNDRSKFILREFARYLKSNPAISIAIQGHTDSDGDDAKNLDLSDRRAKGARDYLVSQGIDAKRLTAKGFGETQPKVANDSAENKAKNRRTDFVITGM
jgi:outer membrane protein OmpA-like peptidoglycan-associated protein